MSVKVKDIYDEVTRLGFCSARIMDRNGFKVQEYECETPDQLVTNLESFANIFKTYGTVEMRLIGDKANGNWKTATVWKVSLNDEKQSTGATNTPAVQTAEQQMESTLRLMMMMKQVFGNEGNQEKSYMDKLRLEMELFKAKNDIEWKKFEMVQNDPQNKYGWMGVPLLSAMGKTPEQIQMMYQMMGAAKIQGAPGMVNNVGPAAVTNARSKFEDLQQLGNDEKNKKIEDLMTVLKTKISAEQWIMVLELLIEKPERVASAINAANQGLI